jgi:cell division protein FtsX
MSGVLESGLTLAPEGILFRNPGAAEFAYGMNRLDTLAHVEGTVTAVTSALAVLVLGALLFPVVTAVRCGRSVSR